MTGFGQILSDLNKVSVRYVLIGGGKSIHLATPHGHSDVLAEQASPLTFAELISRADVRRPRNGHGS